MRLSTASAVVLASAFSLTAGAMAQNAPYNRAINPASLSYGPSSSGAGFVVRGDLVPYSDGAVERDLSCTVLVLVNGAVAGATDVQLHASVSQGPNQCATYCASCDGICFRIGRICFCIGVGHPDNPNSPARFAIPVPPLNPGDSVTLAVIQSIDGLPELDTSDDAASFIIGGVPCPADFNADGAVNSQDFFSFLTAFFMGSPGADVNADGAVNSQDYFDFLGFFFAGC